MSPRQRSSTTGNTGRKSLHSQAPRYTPGSFPESTSISSTTLAADMSNSNFSLLSYNSGVSQHTADPWNSTGSQYFPGNEDPRFPSLSMDSLTITRAAMLDSMVSAPSAYNDAYDMLATGPFPRHDSFNNYSRPTYQANLFHQDILDHAPLSMDFNFDHYQQESWNHGYPTPPRDVFQADTSDCMAPATEDFSTLPPAATECEYIGVSKLQPYRAPNQHRPIRSASERSVSATSPQEPIEIDSPKDDGGDNNNANARNDPRYESKPDKDGLYLCPYVGDGSCNHKPTKQKCIYAKYLDSHLKPYTCRFGSTDENCRNARFSSNACLFRHEREMHGLHNHGMNPYLCRFPGCERARKDMGFPRRWNQRDHMKRVHGWEEELETGADDRHHASEPTKRRKQSGSTSQSVPMKRTSSSHARAQAAMTQGQRPKANSPGMWAQTHKRLPAPAMMLPMSMDDVQYSQYNHPVPTNSYGSDYYVQPVY